LRQSEVIQGKVVEIQHAQKTAIIEGPEGVTFELPYQDVIVTAGADSRVFPIEGLGEAGIGLTRIEEAMYLRSQILERIESAALMTDADQRRRALTLVVVGGGFACVALLGVIEDLARTSISKNPRLAQSDARIVLIEAMGRIMPEVTEEQAELVVEEFRSRGIEVLLNTSLSSAVDNHMKLVNMSDQSDAGSFYADTLVWTAGVAAKKLARSTDIPVEDRGRIEVTPTLQVSDGEGGVSEGAWACGDVAAVPDLTGDGP